MLTIDGTRAHSLAGHPARQSGVTLTALMVGMTVGALVLAGTSAVYLLTARGAAENIRLARLNQELRAAMEVMEQDLLRAGHWEFPDGADPADNPFRLEISGIQNDLSIGSAIGEASGSCVTYSYDLNANSLIGVCDGCTPIASPFDGDAYDRANVEMFGFRLRGGALQIRTRLASASDPAFDCDSGHWEAVTSNDVRVTRLRFDITAGETTNLNPAKARTEPCTDDDLCQQVRSVDIMLAGQLAGDPAVNQTFASRVAVRNDRYWRP
ncbi:MAG: hypothetical protein LJE61_10670 [Thiocapsa sp.]|nr:hypothetical protein [Thiocapsa sp.]MCG6895752.1 hypothetical protein [Thiocapsa sp.]MCG6985643.1 hypothetical protein [Thiocapsa sp.]